MKRNRFHYTDGEIRSLEITIGGKPVKLIEPTEQPPADYRQELDRLAVSRHSSDDVIDLAIRAKDEAE